MTAVFPAAFNPFIFADTLPEGTTDLSTAIQHPAAFDLADVKAAIPDGAATVVLTFVVFAYPDANNTETAFPKPPIVEMLPHGAGFDEPGVALRPTPVGTASLDLGGGQLLNYDFKGLGSGVFQIVVTRNTVALADIDWRLRFTVADGVTGPRKRLGLTLTVGTDGARDGWLAVPGQGAVTNAGPPPMDVGGALRGITLAGAQPADPGHQLPAGRTVTVAIPLANYGPAPLTISACEPAASGHFEVALPAPLVLPPGGSGSVPLTYRPPDDGETGSPATATRFTLVTDDKQAGGAHPATLAFFASATALPSLSPPPQFSPARVVPPAELDDGTVICEVEVLGRNLHVGSVSATFGDVPAETIQPSPRGLVLGVPAVPPGRVRVTVTTAGGSVTSTDLLTVSPHPEISELDPFVFGDHGDSPAGRPFAILGSGFVIAPGDTVQASAVLRARPDGRQHADAVVPLQVLAATASRVDVRAGPVDDFNRFIGGHVTIRVDRSDGGAATLKSFMEGL